MKTLFNCLIFLFIILAFFGGFYVAMESGSGGFMINLPSGNWQSHVFN